MKSSFASWARIVAVAVGWLASGPAHGAPIKVACVGDSITQNSGWSDKLGVRLGAGYTSTNYGVSGTTLLKAGDKPYWNTAAFTQSHTSNPDIVVIMLGTNDSKPFNWNAHKGEFVGDYEALIDTYAALPSHPKIYLNLCPPAGTNGYQIDGAVIEDEVIPDIKQVAAAKGVPTIDVFDAFGGHTLDPSLYGSTADLVHPNAKGAQVIADTVYAALTGAAPDGGADASGALEAGAGDARADSSSGDASSDAGAPAPDATSTGGAGGTGTSTGAAGSGAATGAGGAGGAAGAAGTTVGGTGAAGATGTGGAGLTGAAGTGVMPPRSSSSGGCGVAGVASGTSPLGPLAGVAALAFARRRRRRSSRLALTTVAV